jgi:hypothetical protein
MPGFNNRDFQWQISQEFDRAPTLPKRFDERFIEWARRWSLTESAQTVPGW